MPCVVNLLTTLQKEFMASGAIFRDKDGMYWISNTLRPTKQPQSGLRFWFGDFFGDCQPWVGEQTFKVTASELKTWLDQVFVEANFEPFVADAKFGELLRQSKKEIESGKIKKIVSYGEKRFKTTSSPSSLIVHFLKNFVTAAEETSGYLYGFWQNGKGFMGVTPELLFEKDQTLVSTMALAGTSKLDKIKDLLRSPKDIKEHEMVVKGIADSLKKWGQILVGKTKVKRLPTLAHLETPLSLISPEIKYENLLQDLHPTPALGGFPKSESVQLLRAFDSVLPRRNFGAPFGIEHPDGRGICAVMIRGIQWEKDEVRALAGCGIVRESKLDKENEEFELKMNSILKAAGIQ